MRVTFVDSATDFGCQSFLEEDDIRSAGAQGRAACKVRGRVREYLAGQQGWSFIGRNIPTNSPV